MHLVIHLIYLSRLINPSSRQYWAESHRITAYFWFVNRMSVCIGISMTRLTKSNVVENSMIDCFKAICRVHIVVSIRFIISSARFMCKSIHKSTKMLSNQSWKVEHLSLMYLMICDLHLTITLFVSNRFHFEALFNIWSYLTIFKMHWWYYTAPDWI